MPFLSYVSAGMFDLTLGSQFVLLNGFSDS